LLKHSDQVNQLRSQVSALTETKRLLELDAKKQSETCDRLSEANDKLSQKALLMAEDAEQEKKAMQAKLEREIVHLKTQLQASEDSMEDMQLRLVAELFTLGGN
jgi:hypothetical protein